MKEKILIVGASILERNNKILLVQERKKEVAGKWNFPAGRLREKESLIDCLIREAEEETGFKIKPLYLIGIYQYYPLSGFDAIIFVFRSKILRKKLVTSEEILKIKWFSINELKKSNKRNSLRGPYILEAIKDYKAGRKIPLKFIKILK